MRLTPVGLVRDATRSSWHSLLIQDPAAFRLDKNLSRINLLLLQYSLGPLLKNFELSLMIQMLRHQLHKAKRVSPEGLYHVIGFLCAAL
jgi:hypothetical protein